MKKTISILSFIILFGCVNQEDKNILTNLSQKKNTEHRFDIKSGIITYKTTLSGTVLDNTIYGEGNEKFYFDSWGTKTLKDELINTTMIINVLNKPKKEIEKVHNLQKTENNLTYKVDFKNKIITKSKEDTLSKKNGILSQFGYTKIGNEIINGYDCEIWNISGSKQWLYKGIPLKTEITISGIKTVKEAISADFNVVNIQSNFDLPNYPIK